MADINFNVPNGKLPRIVAAMKGLYPIPVDAEGVPFFTAAEWAKEAVRRLIVRDVRRWELARRVAAIKESASLDDGLLS